MKDLHRRDFIKGVAVLSGAALCGVATPKVAKAAVAPEKMETPHLPWAYQELDPEYVRKLGHLGFYFAECGGGAFWAIMTALREKVGYPYTTLPMPTKEQVLEHLASGKKESPFQVIMQYGAGGVTGFASLCGAPNGSASAITYVAPFNAVEKIVPRLMRYYEKEAFPTDKANEYATKKLYLPAKLKSDKALPQNSSHSVLCHVSVGKWCEKSGYASGSPERSERCGRITGDVAAMAVTLLNAYYKGNLETVFPLKYSQETAGCMTCHTKGEKYETGNFTRGTMECNSCHTDMTPHKSKNVLKTAYGMDIGTLAGAAAVGTVAGIGAHAVSKRVSKGESDHEE